MQRFSGHHWLRLVNSANVEYLYIVQHSNLALHRLEPLSVFLGWAYHIQTQMYSYETELSQGGSDLVFKCLFKASSGICESL